MNWRELLTPKLFPTIQIVLSVCAAIWYFSVGDYRRGTYWIAAAVLTTTVTY